MKQRIGIMGRLVTVVLCCTPTVSNAQSAIAPDVEKARALASAGITDVATFYVSDEAVSLIGKADATSRLRIEKSLKNGSIEQVYHVASRDMHGELGRQGNFPKIGSLDQNNAINSAEDGGVNMPLGFVVRWERSPVSIKYDIVHGEVGKKSRLGKIMVPTYARGAVTGEQTIVFDRPVYSMVRLPAGSKRSGKIAVAVISPSPVSALDALTKGEMVR